jgi:hypothetical protein
VRELVVLASFLSLTLLCGCAISDADRALAREILAQSGNNCVHIEGGYAAGVLPMLGGTTAGGYKGSLSAAHSEDGKSSLTCDSGAAKAESKP